MDAVLVDVVVFVDADRCSVPLVWVVDDVVLDVGDASDDAEVSAGVALPSILSITVLASLIIFLARLSLTSGLDCPKAPMVAGPT